MNLFSMLSDFQWLRWPLAPCHRSSNVDRRLGCWESILIPDSCRPYPVLKNNLVWLLISSVLLGHHPLLCFFLKAKTPSSVSQLPALRPGRVFFWLKGEGIIPYLFYIETRNIITGKVQTEEQKRDKKKEKPDLRVYVPLEIEYVIRCSRLVA